jgi:hypothetical protein
MGGGRRMDYQRFHVSHVGKQGEDLQIVYEPVGCFLTALDVKGEDACPSVGEILLIQVMLGMVRKRRMVHLLYKRML